MSCPNSAQKSEISHLNVILFHGWLHDLHCMHDCECHSFECNHCLHGALFFIVVHHRDWFAFPIVHNWSFTKVACGLSIQSHFLIFALALHHCPSACSLSFGNQVVQHSWLQRAFELVREATTLNHSSSVKTPLQESLSPWIKLLLRKKCLWKQAIALMVLHAAVSWRLSTISLAAQPPSDEPSLSRYWLISPISQKSSTLSFRHCWRSSDSIDYRWFERRSSRRRRRNGMGISYVDGDSDGGRTMILQMIMLNLVKGHASTGSLLIL